MFVPRFVRDPIIRRKTRFSAIDLDSFSIAIARTERDYEQAFGLVHVGYVFQGIEPIAPGGMRITEHHVLPESTVFVARERGQTIGTITVTIDSPAGLSLDADYPAEVDALRGEGVVLAEIGSFCVVRRCWRSGVAPMLAVAAVRFALRSAGVTHFVMGVHPRASDYYRAVWTFEPLGEPRQHHTLRAPVAAFVADIARVKAHFARRFRAPMSRGHSAYDYLFEGAPWPWPDDMPAQLSATDEARWKMPRAVFRDLFLARSDRVESLSPRTRAHLHRRRSDATVQAECADVVPVPALARLGGRHA